MNADLKSRTILLALLIIAWGILIYLKTLLPAAVGDLDKLLALVQLLVPSVIGYHAGAMNSAAAPGAPAAGTQAGLASPALLWLAAAFVAVLCLSGCANPPTPTQAQAIQNACAVDKGLRPSVDLLLAIPGLAKPEELAAITTARAIIDPICANPAGPFTLDPQAELTRATATVMGLAVQLEQRKAAK